MAKSVLQQREKKIVIDNSADSNITFNKNAVVITIMNI